MGVDYTARKAAKKARKAEGRTSVGKRTSALADRDAGVSGGGGATDKKGKRDRPKHGRKGARRMCKGMCYGAAPMLNDDDLEWSPNDHVAAQITVPKPSAAAIAAAAAGAATLRSVAANAEGAPKGFVARKGGGLAGTAPRAPASPEPKTRRLSTGVGALGGGAGHGAPAAAPKQKATTLTPAAAGALAASLTPRVTALAKAGGAWPPTAVQAGVWAAVAAGRDVTAVAPPGAGKTLAYAVPAAAAAAERKAPASTASTSSPVAVILVPARELATQVAAVCTGLRRGGGTGSGVRTALVVGGVDRAAQAAGVKSAAVLVATPGRLLDLVDAGQVDLAHTAVVAVDEADKLLSPGMAPQMNRLRDLLLGPPPPVGGRVVILASATMPAAVDTAAGAWVREGRAEVRVGGGTADATADDDDDDATADEEDTQDDLAAGPVAITQAVHVCAAHKKTGKLLKHLAAVAASAAGSRQRPRVAVFVNRIKTAGEVATALTGAGHRVALLHGGRPQPAREAALASFRAGAATILVATDVAARGLHIPTLRHVVNYDFPPNLETYTHRIGRAGRLEDGGHAFSFFTRPLAPLARPLLRLLDEAGAGVDPNLVRLADAYDEARARLAALPPIGGDEEGGGGGVDAAKAARRAAVAEVLGGDKKKEAKKKKKTRKASTTTPMARPSDSDTMPSSDEEQEEEGEEEGEGAGAAPSKRKAAPLAKADLPGLYKAGKRKVMSAAVDSDDENGGGLPSGEEDLDEEAPAALPSSSKRRKALPGRLRKKQAAARAAANGGCGGGKRK